MPSGQTTLEQVLPLLQVRIFAYDCLRRTFLGEPSKEFLRTVSHEGFIEGFPFAEDSALIHEGAENVSEYLKNQDVLSEEVHDKLHWDYTRMFIGPYELPAPPWESAYLNKERLLFQEETINVRRAYLKYAFLPKDFGHEADDHLGLELDFMYQLSELAEAKVSKQDIGGLVEVLRDQKAFLEDHLLKWVPEFSKQAARHAQTQFYEGMVKILAGFLELDLKALEELLDINV
ncbi:TorD/DmsD family molecular chaperone [Desulfosporosinus youngiae]|uniref:Putative component of anaerobic dehydrogenase n=1 Tax=Desulfosporosinus youngiae DSM 17734 TaxID=768710 RepID=H5Y5R2_9FIRM|nr:molecular chaperone TorD family protein [Desulfosporosinus youngiae]EHQ90788.1 putative component of anaerobic dehydrogenase [Desulfosporosinus youngiae DSM 17734]